MADRTELELAGFFLLLGLNADELVHVGRLTFLVEVLEVDDRCAAGVLLDVIDRLFAGDLDPADIKLGLEQVSGNLGIDIIECILTVRHLYKLEIVVMVKQRDADFIAGFADLLEGLNVLEELLGARTIFFHQIRDGNVLHADLLVLCDRAFDVGFELLERNVCGKRNEAHFFQNRLDFRRLHAIKACKLNAVIAHVLDFLHGALKIALSVIADRINLYRYG